MGIYVSAGCSNSSQWNSTKRIAKIQCLCSESKKQQTKQLNSAEFCEYCILSVRIEYFHATHIQMGLVVKTEFSSVDKNPHHRGN